MHARVLCALVALWGCASRVHAGPSAHSLPVWVDADGLTRPLGRGLAGAGVASGPLDIESDLDPGASIASGPSALLNGSAAAAPAARIAYAAPAVPSQFPFAVYIDVQDFFCTGTLITPTVVLTAAHCIRPRGVWVDRARLNVLAGSATLAKADIIPVRAMYTPRYNSANQYADVALLRLAREAPARAEPVTLATSTRALGGARRATVLGWGQTQNGGEPQVLRFAREPVLSTARCDALHAALGGKRPWDKMCFGLGANPAVTTCGGDSGGPFLVRAGTTGRYVQVALVSYGPSTYTCGDSTDNYDVATKVGYWARWIDDTIKSMT